MGGWVGVGGGGWEEKWRLRLNSAQFQVKLPAGAELGNIIHPLFVQFDIIILSSPDFSLISLNIYFILLIVLQLSCALAHT